MPPSTLTEAPIGMDEERAARDLAARLSASSDQDQTLTEELWRQLTTGDPVEVDPHSLAVPPSWKP